MTALTNAVKEKMLPRLPVDYGIILILLFVAMCVVHFVRRAYRQPARTEPKQAVQIPGNNVKEFDIVQRLYHWLLFVTLGIMLVTGLSIEFPNTFNSLMTPFGVSSTTGDLFWHVEMVWALLGLIVIHIVYDLVVAKGWKNIWIRVRDIKDLPTRTKNFFGLTKTYPRPGKYDVFMKTLHWGFAFSIVVLGITGIFMWNPYGLFPGISPYLDSWFRLFHDTFSFLFIGLLIGHMYFSLIPANWKLTRAIFTGSVSKQAYEDEYNPERYPAVPTSKEKKPEEEKRVES